MIPGGMLKQIGDDLRTRGFSEQNSSSRRPTPMTGP